MSRLIVRLALIFSLLAAVLLAAPGPAAAGEAAQPLHEGLQSPVVSPGQGLAAASNPASHGQGTTPSYARQDEDEDEDEDDWEDEDEDEGEDEDEAGEDEAAPPPKTDAVAPRQGGTERVPTKRDAANARATKARAGLSVATGLGIPTMVVGLSLGPVGVANNLLFSQNPAGGFALVTSNALVWGSFGVSLGGAQLAHEANPAYNKRDMISGALLAVTGTGLFSLGTITATVSSGCRADNPLYVSPGLCAADSAEYIIPPLILLHTGAALTLAGNIALMASARGAHNALSRAARSEQLRSRPRFAAAPLIAPVGEGLVLGVSGLF